ncbi:hypothetical protein CPB83DRAFT_773231 [Crepidotus variabilis]|uniref:F-box domain-containing protein n=1 Tax=Crepidotus variabilis TaxID=179855 RepID=A0A9P6E935_9AGAR|nr:hypothetical protein CPB83DRAFT_773231 [Crepidotus variabilis]
MQKVLLIPELLDLIFGLVDTPSNAVNARVCKAWSSIALDALWREVDDLPRLFSLLAPLQRIGTTSEEYFFAELPDAARWKRFEKYSSRIRRFAYCLDPSEQQIHINKSVFDEIARTRTRLNFLPNMHNLVWKAPLNSSVVFMHSSIKTFDIWLPDELEETSPRPFFQDVVARMPNITNLNIRSYVAVHDIETELIELLNGLPKLHTITLPRFYLTSNVSEALSRLPNLAIIEFQYFAEQGCGNPDDVVPYAPTLSEGAFPLLWDHSLTAQFSDVARFFNLDFAPTNITTLYVDSGIDEMASSIENFLVVLVENCQLLKYLALVSLRDAGSPQPMEDEQRFKITMDHLKPIFKLPNLRSLELLHHHSLALQQTDIENIAFSFPAMETLILNNEPVILDESSLTMEALGSFARHCPYLTHLGLFIDTTGIQASLSPSAAMDLIPFKSLRRLSMGVSIITDDNAASLYLSHILPVGCTVDCGITWDETVFAARDVYKNVQDRCELWTKVDRVLPVLVRLRVEEKERLRLMERELDDLRMRNGVLKDSSRLVAGLASNDSTCVIT